MASGTARGRTALVMKRNRGRQLMLVIDLAEKFRCIELAALSTPPQGWRRRRIRPLLWDSQCGRGFCSLLVFIAQLVDHPAIFVRLPAYNFCSAQFAIIG